MKRSCVPPAQVDVAAARRLGTPPLPLRCTLAELRRRLAWFSAHLLGAPWLVARDHVDLPGGHANAPSGGIRPHSYSAGMGEATALDWGILVATAITALFTGWAIWQRWRYTPRPLWVSSPHAKITWYSRGTVNGAWSNWRIENRGDGAAHDVCVFVVRGDGQVIEFLQPGTAIVEPGGHVEVWEDLGEYTGEVRYDPETKSHWDTRVLDWTFRAAELRWRQHPNLNSVKRKRIPLPSLNDWTD